MNRKRPWRAVPILTFFIQIGIRGVAQSATRNTTPADRSACATAWPA